MAETFLALFAAHLISDFVLQWDRMVANKRKPRVLAAHIAIVGLSAAILIGARDSLAIVAVLVIVVTHLLIDSWKIRAGDTLFTFIADQAAHVAVVAVIASAWPHLAQRGFWALLPGDIQAFYYAALVFIAGFVAAVPLGGILIKKLIKPFIPPGAPNAGQAPLNAGRYIGWLERGLTFAFIVARQPEGVGFLLAAKSLLRIGDLRDQQDRSHAEYIIIGTFLSFGWALIFGFVALAGARHWIHG